MIIAIITLIFLVPIVTNTLALATNIWPINIIFLFNMYIWYFQLSRCQSFCVPSLLSDSSVINRIELVHL